MTNKRIDSSDGVASCELGEGPLDTATGRQIGAILLVGLGLITCMVGLGTGPAMGDHECVVAQTARQSIQSGEWLIPYLAEVPQIRKTPLGIWLTGAASWLVDDPSALPVSEVSAKLPSAAAGVVNMLVVWWLGTMLFGRRAGLVAGFVAAGCAATIVHSHNAQVDMLLTLFTTLSFACFWRAMGSERPSGGFVLAFWAAFALAMMAKAPLPLAIVGVSLGVYWFVTVPVARSIERRVSGEGGGFVREVLACVGEQFRRLPMRWLLPGVVLFVVIAGAWPLYVFLKIDNAPRLWAIEYLDRYSGQLRSHSQPFLYYIPIVFGLAAPFLLSLPEAVAAPFLKRYRPQRDGLLFAFTWAIVGTLFLSTSSFKRPHYVLSVMPAYCLLLGPVIDRLFFGAASVTSRAVQWTCRLLPVALGAGLITGGVFVHMKYPALVRAYAVVSVPALIVWATSCGAYARGRRTASFALLLVSVVLLVLLGWPAAGQHLKGKPELKALVAGLRAHGISPNDTIYWVKGPRDASLDFYSEYRVERLINEIELASMRGDRKALSAALYKEFARRIQEKLAEPRPVYFVMSAGHLNMLSRKTDTRAHVVFRLEGFHESPEDEMVVITQSNRTQP